LCIARKRWGIESYPQVTRENARINACSLCSFARKRLDPGRMHRRFEGQ
jgi:hypothetical protein